MAGVLNDDQIGITPHLAHPFVPLIIKNISIWIIKIHVIETGDFIATIGFVSILIAHVGAVAGKMEHQRVTWSRARCQPLPFLSHS